MATTSPSSALSEGSSSKTEREVGPAHKLSVPPENDGASSTTSVGESSGHSTPLTDPVGNAPPEPSSAPASKETQHHRPDATSTANHSSPSPICTPFEHPLPSCFPKPRAPLTSEQSAKYATLLAIVSKWTEIPTNSERDAPKEPLNDLERMFLTHECLLRYLRATNWSSAAAAAQRLQSTLIWRREFGADKLTADHVSEENETGKQVILGYDNDARPCLYLDPGRQNTKKSERQIQHLVFMLDRVIEMMDAGQETTALLITFKGSTAGGSPSVSQGRQVLNILQGHYPERLGKALISDLPWYVTTFFKLISPFIDPVTKSKMIFNQPLRDTYVPASQLWKNHGGDANFVYDHAVYWPALNKLCEQRRKAYTERWVSAGKKIGEHEAYLRGGQEKSLSESEAVSEAA